MSVDPGAEKFDIVSKEQGRTQKCDTFFGPKKVKFGTQTDSNMQDSMVMFTFSIFDRKYPFWANLFQNLSKI